ncbi:MAG: DNA mismatch repair protein MutS [Altererythrobacter sp.]|nr:DNA mismatch repair protein MutS [Altererythrobacter sp.]NNF94099.1 DNA mismatch repair protein MutS [Altererythrobacter sp.]NNK46866.1 DNA mismatch repair protein MutS [Altererythrobacter sp.]
MSIPRGLSAEEAAAWAKLASSVTPLEGRKLPQVQPGASHKPASTAVPPKPMPQHSRRPAAPVSKNARPVRPHDQGGLDGHWDRKLKAGDIAPDFTLDLHGHNLDSAHARLMDGMAQARAMGARMVLLIAGRSRPVDPADRQHRRGAIRAKLLDWLAASEHGDAIAAIRKAHQRHGGSGALYLVLRRGR